MKFITLISNRSNKLFGWQLEIKQYTVQFTIPRKKLSNLSFKIYNHIKNTWWPNDTIKNQ